MNCNKCGYSLKVEDAFCSGCGEKVDFTSVEQSGVSEGTPVEFDFVKSKGFSYGNYKTISTKVTCIGNNIEINTKTKIFKTHLKNTFIKHSDIQSVANKVHFDFWDILFAVGFVIAVLFGASAAYLLLAVVFVLTAYGKVIRLELKNGTVIEIPHHGADEANRFFTYINTGKTVSLEVN